MPCTHHGIPIPGPNPVILRLSHFVKCISHSLNSSHSPVASNVNPDSHKQHLSKWHSIHYTPLHTQKGGIHPDISGTLPKLQLNYSISYILFCYCLQTLTFAVGWTDRGTSYSTQAVPTGGLVVGRRAVSH